MTFSALHRIAAVVLLRMLQESAHVAREIVLHNGVKIFLRSLDQGKSIPTYPAGPESFLLDAQ